jgi:hypothetical protein
MEITDKYLPNPETKYYINMEKKKTLVEIFKEIGHFGEDIGCNDKNGTHTYLETYDKLFEPFKNNSTILEIGLATGDSIKLWDRYFNKSKIVGIDLSIVFKSEDNNNLNLIYLIEGDATKPEILEELPEWRFDIIIDDGSHQTQDQLTTFFLFNHRMNKGGLYIIEDILALDQEREKYLALHDNVEIIDMRDNGRFDNVLIVIQF